MASVGQRQEDPVVSQNLQREKSEFLRNARLDSDEEVLDHVVRPAITPYEVKAGSLVPAVLITQANSDLPGQLIAQVRENVFDSATGAHLLIPQGTRAIGVYDSVVAFGQERVLVAWQRLIFPDGSSLNLGSMPGTDLAGAAGFRDRVHHDYVRTFGGAVLLSAISAGLQISQGTFASANQATGTSDLREILAAALGQNLGDLGTEMAQRNMNVQPALEIRSGYRFNIAVMKDLILPGPYPAS
jgi:type IV secretion system protein VirB10